MLEQERGSPKQDPARCVMQQAAETPRWRPEVPAAGPERGAQACKHGATAAEVRAHSGWVEQGAGSSTGLKAAYRATCTLRESAEAYSKTS